MNTYSVKNRLALLAAVGVLCGFSATASIASPDRSLLLVEKEHGSSSTMIGDGMSTEGVVVYKKYTSNCEKNLMGRSKGNCGRSF